MVNNKNRKRILITNIVTLNPGDAAILQGMFQILRRKYGENADIVVFDRLAAAASRYYPWASFRQSVFGNSPKGKIARGLRRFGYGHWSDRLRYWFLRSCVALIRSGFAIIPRTLIRQEDYSALKEYCAADVVISTGGTYLIENYNLWPAIYDYRLTLACGRPLVFFTQSLGPYHNAKYQAAFRHIFRHSYGIFLRDEKSWGHVAELGVGENNIVLGKDAAFVLKPQKTLSAPRDSVLEAKQELKVAVSVRSLHFFDEPDKGLESNYVSCIVAMVEQVVREFGAEVTFLSTCQGIDEYWTDDADYAQKIFENLSSDVTPYVNLDTAFRQPVEVVEAYQEFDLVIATRMHAAILGLVAGTPVLGIAYEFKLEELFHQLGMDAARLSTKSMGPEQSRAVVSDMLVNLIDWQEKVRSVQEDCSRQAISVMDKLPDV
ncbi:MAG: polysaccharide pyruvyl transferase family protein [Marinobacter sp.]|uniref:polysaccharide pyruvyl transferase family protein n=1 Tax=Marinobacter sp. TaxID=50741 RepID=UPI003296FA77